MSFAFRPTDRSVQSALRRIARAELGAALTLLGSGTPTPEGVHGLRKHTKKLRGLIRLVRPVFPGFGPANAALRDGAGAIAALRDAEVRLATLSALADGLPPGTADAGLAALRAEVAALRDPQAAGVGLAAMTDTLAALREDARGWRLTAQGWDALEPGLTDTWRAARAGRKRAARALAKGEGAEPFHDWRKAIKHHWYQARLLEPLWPAMLAPQIAAADVLGEDLGAHNDLDVLRTHLARHADPAVAELAKLEALRAAQDDLARRCLADGARFLADRPRALAHRWGTWWDAWRAGA